MDYSNFERNDKMYSGAERKIGLRVGNEDYIIKFPKKERFLTRNNHISEYIGCRIIASMGYLVQETYLGQYKGEDIVAIKDFVEIGQQFVAFNDVGESSIEADRDAFTYSYDDITKILHANNKLKDPDETVKMFWELYVIDALLGNFDRHGANWGFIKENNEYSLSPIFDNGSCMFPRMTDEDEMLEVMASEEETCKRIFEFPTSQIRLNEKKSSYYGVISSMSFKECNEALVEVYGRFDLEVAENIIDGIGIISQIHKDFYKHMLRSRYELLLKETYERLKL